jgi:integrase
MGRLRHEIKGSRRSIRLTESALAALKRHRKRQLEERMLLPAGLWEDNGLVFTTSKGTPVDVSNFTYRSFRPLLQRAGLPQIRMHDLRHTCATLLLTQNVNPKKVQELLGHANIAETMDTYSHVLPNMQDEVAAEMEIALS